MPPSDKAYLERVLKAIEEGKSDAVTSHLAAGLDPNARVRGKPLLYYASAHPAILRALVLAGADPDKGAPLCATAARGDVASCRLLLDRGADPNGPAGAPQTPLVLACIQDHADVVALLLERKADPNRASTTYVNGRTEVRGYTPLMAAAEYARPAVIESLLAAGGDHRLVDSRAQTVLGLARDATNRAVLLRAGATPPAA
jgi:ankyrin repeat protein